MIASAATVIIIRMPCISGCCDAGFGAKLSQLPAHRTRLILRALLDRHRRESRTAPMMVIIMSIARMAAVIIISVPIIISSANTAVIILDLAMIVMTMMTTTIGARGNDGGAASGGEHGGAAGKEFDLLGPSYGCGGTWYVSLSSWLLGLVA